MAAPLQYTQSITLPAAEPSWHNASFSITLSGELAILQVDYEYAASIDAAIANDTEFQDIEIARNARARILIVSSKDARCDIQFSFPYLPLDVFDQLANGNWVIGLAHHGSHIGKALLIDRGGSSTIIPVGMDLRYLQADPDGSFWTGCSDYGVFFGCDISRGCINNFSACGKHLSGFDAADTDATYDIDCTECMNISRFGRFAFVWDRYGLLDLDDRQSRSLKSGFALTDAFANDGNLFAVCGSWTFPKGQDRTGICLLEKPARKGARGMSRLWAGQIKRPSNGKLRLHVGRADCLHFVTETRWYRLSLPNMLGQLEHQGFDKYPLPRFAAY